MITNKRENDLIFHQILSTNVLKKMYKDQSGEFCCECWLSGDLLARFGLVPNFGAKGRLVSILGQTNTKGLKITEVLQHERPSRLLG